jgi:hypothetical protein
MLNFNRFVQTNIPLVSIVLFLILFIIILISKPNIIFDKQGVPREFGIGYKKKTVLPIWLVVIILAIISYFIILYYLNYRKIMF